MPPSLERIRQHMSDPQSQHRKIIEGFLWVSLFVFLGKLAGAAKEMTIAWRYGVSATVDAYVFIFNLVNWPISIWFSILSIVLVPRIARLRVESPEDLPRFRAELLGLTLIVGVGLAVLGWFGLPLLLDAGWLGLSGAALGEALGMSHGLALLALFGAPISLFSALLLAVGRHRNTLFEAIPAFVLLFFLLFPPGWISEPLLWGTLAGYALHMAALAAPLKQRGELSMPAVTRHSPAWRSFWGSIGVMAVGQVLMGVTTLIDQFFAAGLDTGALSTLSYANRILALMLGLGATAISRATLPVFSAAQTQGGGKVKALALRWAIIMLMLGMAALIAMWIIAPWIVNLLFVRGEFTQENAHSVTQVLRLSLWQVPFYFSGLVLVSALAAQHGHIKIAISGALNLIFKFPIALVLTKLFQLEGLVASTSVMYVLSACLLYVLLKIHRPI